MTTARNVIIIAALILGVAFFTTGYFAVTQGFTVTSVSVDTPIITESTNLKNVKYIVNTVFDGGGHAIQGTISSSKFAQSGYESEHDFTIKVDNPQETASYSIWNTGTPIYVYSSELVDDGECGIDAVYVIEVKAVLWFISIHVNDICIYEKIDARFGRLDSPNVRNKADITVSIDDGTSVTESFDVSTNTIDSKTAKTVYFNDAYDNRLVDATWTGNLVTGDTPPSESLYVATYALEDSRWRDEHEERWWLSYESEYDDYTDARTSAITRFKAWRDFKTEADVNSVEGYMDIVNAEIALVNAQSAALVGGSEATIDGKAPTYADRDNLNAGEVIVSLDDRTINYMNVVFKISADWIGVVIPVGEPEIVDISCEDFASGDASGVCTVEVKNVGESAGTFIATMSDCGIFSQKFTPQASTFDVGETDSLKVYIEHGTAAAETTQTCVFKVTDISDAANYDTATCSIHMTTPKACVPNTFRVSGQCVFPCNPTGTGELEPLCCTTDETLQMGTGGDFGGWYCKEKPVSDGPSWFENLFGEDGDGFPSLNVILFGILIVAMVIIGLLMFYGILKAVIIRKLT